MLKKMKAFTLVMPIMVSSLILMVNADSNPSIDENILRTELQKYYLSRYDGVGEIELDIDTLVTVSDAVESDNMSRKEGLIRLQNAAHVEYYGIDCSIEDFSMGSADGNYSVSLLESTTVYYLDSGVGDSFSFKIPHTLTMTDNMKIISDVYCENTISGFDNTTKTQGAAEYTDVSGENDTKKSGMNRAYNMTGVINYAQTYANSVNPAYGTLPADCANFVSQCLHEGGVSYVNYGNYNGGWYFVSPSSSGSKPWVQVNAFDTFWLGYGLTRQTGNTTNIIPGNPFYWRSEDSSTGTGHLMMCTGYNAAGNLVYCAHNSNVLNGLVSSALASNTANKYTLLFHSKCSNHTFPGTWNYNSSSHWWYCSVCGVKREMSGHNYIYSGSYMTCRICGYTRHI